MLDISDFGYEGSASSSNKDDGALLLVGLQSCTKGVTSFIIILDKSDMGHDCVAIWHKSKVSDGHWDYSLFVSNFSLQTLRGVNRELAQA